MRGSSPDPYKVYIIVSRPACFVTFDSLKNECHKELTSNRTHLDKAYLDKGTWGLVADRHLKEL